MDVPSIYLPTSSPYHLLDLIVSCEEGWCYTKPRATECGAIRNGSLDARIAVAETEDGLLTPRYLVPMIERVRNYPTY